MSSQTAAPGDAGELPSVDDYAVGDTVTDRETDDDDTATVINLPPVTCDDWVIYDGSTVAEDNPTYDTDTDVVVVAFDDDLAEHAPTWDGDEPLTLAEASVRFYAFPPGRLRRVEPSSETPTTDPDAEAGAETPSDPDGDALDGHDDVRALRDRLEERSAVEVGVEDGAPVLRVDKLGVTHTIAADGSVSDGPVADRLRDVAAEYLGGEAE